MKIIDSCFPHNGDEIALSQLSIEYTQDLDTCQSESEFPDGCQILTITTDDGGGGKFIRLKTGDSGWSFDNIETLVELLNDFKQRLKCE